MGYYDDKYNGNYYKDEECSEPISLIGEDFSEEALTDVILSAGLTSENRPKYTGNMEKLVFMYGEDSEVYSPAEIRFIESIENVLVYQEFTKTLNSGDMICRAIATRFNLSGHDELRACVSFEKIIDKALDGFNIFFFVTEENVYLGSRIFDKTGKRDCSLSNPIKDEYELEQIVDELAFLSRFDSFMHYYSNFQMIIMEGQDEYEDYEQMLMRRRGMQMSYLENISRIEQDMGVNMSGEKERYQSLFYNEPIESFISLLKEVEESLSFIKSNRVNTFEMLYEADEMMRQAEKTESENARLVAQTDKYASYRPDSESDEEAKALLSDPEEMIKLLKKRRGI